MIISNQVKIYTCTMMTVLLFSSGCSAGEQGKPKTFNKDGRTAVTALGRVLPGRAVIDIGVPPGDRVAKLEVKEMDKVAVSNVLAYLESHTLRIAERDHARAVLSQAEAAVKLCEAQFENEKNNYNRIKSLHADKVVPDQNYDNQSLLLKSCELNLSKSQAEHKACEAQLAAAEARLELSVIRAPMSGSILRVFTYPGEATGQSPILQMGDTDHMYVVAEIHETDIKMVKLGQRAAITSPALEKELHGVVDEIGQMVFRKTVQDLDPRADVDTRVIEVRVKVEENEAVAALSHLKVYVRIDTASAPVPAVK